MLVVKVAPSNWKKETLFMHFVEDNGASTVFTVYDQALQEFSKCELYRIYDMNIPGKCVHQCHGKQQHAVPSVYEVKLRFPCGLKLSQIAWPLRFPYEFQSWDNLNQIEAPGSCVDVLGQVLEAPIKDIGGKLHKLVVKLGNADMQLEVEFLGHHADGTFAKGTKLAVSGVRIKEWNKSRTLQTSFLSVIEQNPRIEDNILKRCYDTPEEGPKRKAIRMTPKTIFTVSEAKQLCEKMQEDVVNDSKPNDPQEFVFKCQIVPFTTDFFEKDAPIIETKNGEVMCLKTVVEDATGHLFVKLWDKPCYDYLHLTADKLRELWEKGNDHAEQQDTILETLHARTDESVLCSCRADVWNLSLIHI